ncbi:hypothetical protein M3G03_10320 [Aestuariimicrobium sp. p3-SID1156]|uniref:hypothetical protein n=1 Tax=Aestuariimicrobium sp. p3-SID1156 TaxID=2916038 RepID=UPI00223B8C04|nr:hypothetical protein [Aestuariimicrobium sp. p3-SID1156]MCT1459926.1 hypothetical protein [Aestuariimicrobium sp. p3-SID1156]
MLPDRVLTTTFTLARRPLLTALLVGGLTACEYPRDPDGTLERVLTDKKLRVGVSPSEPWVEVGKVDHPVGRASEHQIGGVEPRLVSGFAKHLGVEPVWEVDGEAGLVEKIELGMLDLAIGGFTADSQWTSKMGVTRAYTKARDGHGKKKGHVIGAPLGENAFISELERYLDSRPAAEKGGEQ